MASCKPSIQSLQDFHPHYSPVTEQQWIVAIQHMKGLYFTRQHKQCAASCTALLSTAKAPHPVYTLHLTYHLALSIELHALSMPLLSTQRTTLLSTAKEHYQTCQSLLSTCQQTHPSTLRIPSNDSTTSSATTSPLYSPTTSPRTVSPSSSISSLNSISEPLSPTSTSPHTKHLRGISIDPLKPSPLKIRKTVRFADTSSPSTYHSDIESSASPSPHDDRPSTPTHQRTSTPDSPSSSSPSPGKSTQTWLHLRSLARFTALLSSLSADLDDHLASIDKLSIAAERAKTNRALVGLGAEAGERPEGFGRVNGIGDEDVRKVEIRARIERGRREGWARKRWDGRRCEGVRRRAVHEL
ncbi:MAG: hypothetical protein M1824_004773 [Vezdaea acicularis]|nr:MAG: hypothetical protein M1824_004773 [Vezdaea acicularis]